MFTIVNKSRNYVGIIATKSWSSGAKIYFFSNKRYKFFPSEAYTNMKNKMKEKPPIAESIEEVIDNFFISILKKKGL